MIQSNSINRLNMSTYQLNIVQYFVDLFLEQLARDLDQVRRCAGSSLHAGRVSGGERARGGQYWFAVKQSGRNVACTALRS